MGNVNCINCESTDNVKYIDSRKEYWCDDCLLMEKEE